LYIPNTLLSHLRLNLARLKSHIQALLDSNADLVLPEFLFQQLDKGLLNFVVQGIFSALTFGRVN